MSNRIIKESIRTSKDVNSLTDFQFRVWVYLITYVDDYGRGSADPELLKGLVFTRRRGITEQQISKALADLANTGMITLYEVDGESYLYFPSWDKHQRVQNKKSKFPEPNADNSQCFTVGHGESPFFTVGHGESPHESESNPNPESKSEFEDSLEPQSVSRPPAVCLLPLNTGEEYAVTAEQADEWAKLYPAVDILQELNAMRGWCLANPGKRKTPRGIMKFINGWLSREQDRGWKKPQTQNSGAVTNKKFVQMLRKEEGYE